LKIYDFQTSKTAGFWRQSNLWFDATKIKDFWRLRIFGALEYEVFGASKSEISNAQKSWKDFCKPSKNRRFFGLQN